MSIWEVYLYYGSSHFIHQAQRNVGIMSIRKDVVSEAKGRPSAKDVKKDNGKSEESWC